MSDAEQFEADLQEFPEEAQEEVSVEELLISCVQARPPLWDSRLSIKERSKTIRDKLWLEIFQEFGENPNFSTDYLTKKWRNLRDTFVRLKGEYIPSGSAAKKKKKWEYFEAMSFLSDTISYKQTVSNLDLLSPSSSRNSPTPPMMSPTSSKSTKEPTQKIEGALVNALNKINSVPLYSNTPATPPINPICEKISGLLEHMPLLPRTQLEIQLLQVAYEGSKEYLK